MTQGQQRAVAVILIILVIAGLGLYFFSGGSPATDGTPSGAGSFPESSSQGIGSTQPIRGTGQTGSTTPTDNETAAGAAALGAANRLSIRKLTTSAIAGVVAMPGTTPRFRYVERESGHVFEQTQDSNEPLKISGTTIPRVHKATWARNGSYVVFTVQTESGDYTFNAYNLSSATNTKVALLPTFFPKNARDFVISPDSSKLFFTEINGIRTAGSVLDLKTASIKKIFESPLTEWNLEWNTPSQISLTTKASSDIEGFSVLLNATTGAEKRILGNRNGLSVSVSPDGNSALFSEGIQNFLTTAMLAIQTGTTVPVGITTLPEKCTWSKLEGGVAFCGFPEAWPATKLPDSWYKGLFQTDDSIWRVGGLDPIVEFEPSGVRRGEPVDATNLTLDQNEQYLYFINRRDGALWSVQLYADQN